MPPLRLAGHRVRATPSTRCRSATPRRWSARASRRSNGAAIARRSSASCNCRGWSRRPTARARRSRSGSVSIASTAKAVSGARPSRSAWAARQGGYRSGVGLGIGINLGGGPRKIQDLQLAVRIDDSASGQALWEGRAIAAVPVKAPASQPSLAAAKLADALFKDFPPANRDALSASNDHHHQRRVRQRQYRRGRRRRHVRPPVDPQGPRLGLLPVVPLPRGMRGRRCARACDHGACHIGLSRRLARLCRLREHRSRNLVPPRYGL